jgi:hypothetical protein
MHLLSPFRAQSFFKVTLPREKQSSHRQNGETPDSLQAFSTTE